MTEVPQSAEVGVSKAKTKAKARYLKRKKLRRKARKPSTPQESRDVPQDSSESEKDEEHYNNVEGIVDEVDGDGVSEERVVAIERLVQPHKKKQKFIEEGSDSDVDDSVEVWDSRSNLKEPPSTQIPLANPTGTLPSFPSPMVPNAPSKSVLTMQGIDKALIHAQVINPAPIAPLSTAEEDPDTGLSLKTRRRLLDLGISELFAVQTTLLPFLLHRNLSLYSPYVTLQDVCVSAPTGSGKTLAYVLPMLEVLSSRIVTRLRALIVLPTRDLVMQVRETFEVVGKGRGIKIGTATGQHSFAHEQAQLVSETDPRLLGGSSKVDILICTPGRLIDHLNGTPNFSLQHLRFLVIDEADRLLSQSFQEWLARVLTAIHWRPSTLSLTGRSSSENTYISSNCDSLAPACLDFEPCGADVGERKEFSCQKLLFSATLTRDPGRLASIGLRDPKYFVVQSYSEGGSGSAPSHITSEGFAMPTSLVEHMVVCEASQKPLILLHLIYNCNIRNALIFTKSSESTSRLVFLLECFDRLKAVEQGHIAVRAYSSDLPVGERKTILERFKAQEIHILVCSDLISRGIDISHVSHVVSYDAPVDMRKYVHRVGRTARAGREGDAWTLVEEQEARYFKAMLKEHDHLQKVKRMKVLESEVQPFLGNYQEALRSLRDMCTR